jgi:glycosyltransferase involved in cell wall biosynthesis
MKIALVHDYLVQCGGAEKVLECFGELFPDAPIFTLIYDKKLTHGTFSQRDIRTSFLQKIPFSRTRHRIFPPLMAIAIEQFDFSNYDVVLSDSSSFAHGIITDPKTLHICYIHTPMRYAWDDCQKYIEDFYFPRFIKKIVPLFMNYIRVWDRVSADRPDRLIANSNFIARRIKKYYKRDSIVIHPPVETRKFFMTSKVGDYFLLVGRLMAYKRFDIVIEAFNQLGWKLKVIGRGAEFGRLKKIAGYNIEFLGRVSDVELYEQYSKCKAFIFPQEEDFGITAIEAMASGRPIIAYRGGDIPEHMEENKTGLFFDQQNSECLIEILRKFNEKDFDCAYIRKKALEFDKEIFKAKIGEYIDKEMVLHKKRLKN